MLRKCSFLAVGPVFLLAAAVLAGEPIFDRKTGHPWDQAHDIFYVRRFSTGEVFDNPHAFAPPWREYQPFVHDAAFYEQVVARLEAVQNLPAAQMEEQAAPRRLIFFTTYGRFSTASCGRVWTSRAIQRPVRRPSPAATICCAASRNHAATGIERSRSPGDSQRPRDDSRSAGLSKGI